MRLVIFGLTVSSAWANGHATTWRGLLKALNRQGHHVTFFERDAPWYAAARDLPNPEFCELVLYQQWDAVLPAARQALASADVGLVTSFCPDGVAAAHLVADTPLPVRAFYDIDTPRTLAALAEHGYAMPGDVTYLTPDLIPQFDLYLSFTGGPLLADLEQRWGARRAIPLFCAVDPELHAPVPPEPAFRCDLGYLGTYSADRQPSLDRLLVQPARQRPEAIFRVAGSQYPPELAWPPNVRHHQHLPPAEHAAFYCSNRLTLNVTRQDMLAAGYSPSVRLFEAASCGVPILTDPWPGLAAFFTPGEQILTAGSTAEALAALDYSDAELRRMARSARERTLAEHTCAVRARQLVAACEAAAQPDRAPTLPLPSPTV